MSDIHALSGAYAVDAVDDIERASFERHLAECPSCRAEVASLRETSAALAGVGAAVWQPWQDDTSPTLTAADRVLADPDAQRITQELPNGATATIVRSAKEHRAVLVTEGLPAPPDGK